MAKVGRKKSGKVMKNMNVKFPEEVYNELQQIADNLGGMTMSSMVRIIVFAQLEKVRKTGDAKSFLDIVDK